jgi:hypothetical protein
MGIPTDKGFKLVLKTLDTTNIILLDSRDELKESSPSNMKKSQADKSESKSKRRKKKNKDEDFQSTLNENQQLELYQFDPKKTRSRAKEIDSAAKENCVGKTTEPDTTKELSQEAYKKLIEDIKDLMDERLKTPPPQIFFVSTDKITPELQDKLIRSRKSFIDPEIIVINDDDKIRIKKEVDRKPIATSFKMEKPDGQKPRMMRKFVPPVRKRRRSPSPDKECEIIETKNETIDLNDSFEGDAEMSTSSKLHPKSPVDSRQLSKLHHINAWFARTQKSWCVKNRNVLACMKTKNSLVSTFKCMATNCSYTTIDAGNFAEHLSCHKKQEDNDPFLYFCPYCFFRSDSDSSAGSSDPAAKLIHHYENYHRYDKAQCGLCFYRSAEAQSTWEHMEECHPGSQKLIFETSMEKRVVTEDVEKRHMRMRRNVAPLVCTSELNRINQWLRVEDLSLKELESLVDASKSVSGLQLHQKT